jgi:hypothetical protein
MSEYGPLTNSDSSGILKIIANIQINSHNNKKIDYDRILCNEKITKVGYNNNNDSYICKNYRRVETIGDPKAVVFLRVGSSDITGEYSSDGVTTSAKYGNFIEKYCDKNDEYHKKFMKIYNTDKDSVIYFKGAFTSYHIKSAIDNDDQSKKVGKFISDNALLYNVFKEGTRGLMIRFLKDFKEAGFKLIVVDPEPGWHPKTTNMTDDERLDGLIKLYEQMGLKKIKCHLRTTAQSLMKNEPNYTNFVNGIRENMNVDPITSNRIKKIQIDFNELEKDISDLADKIDKLPKKNELIEKLKDLEQFKTDQVKLKEFNILQTELKKIEDLEQLKSELENLSDIELAKLSVKDSNSEEFSSDSYDVPVMIGIIDDLLANKFYIPLTASRFFNEKLDNLYDSSNVKRYIVGKNFQFPETISTNDMVNYDNTNTDTSAYKRLFEKYRQKIENITKLITRGP